MTANTTYSSKDKMDCARVAREEILEAYLVGKLTDQDRDAFEEHYFECARCFEDLRALQAIAGELQQTGSEFEDPKRRPFRRWVPAAGLAAAGVLAAVLWMRPTLPSSSPGATQAPPPSQSGMAHEWREAQANALTQTKDGRYDETGAIYEKFVAAHPNFGPARLALGQYLQGQATAINDRSPKSVATRTQYLERAAGHYRLAVDAATDRDDAAMALDSLIGTYDVDNLNKPAEALLLARGGVAKYPDQPVLVARLLPLLLPTATEAATADALGKVRAEIPPTPEARLMYGMFLFELVQRSPGPLPRGTTETLLAEAVTALDDALKSKPDSVEALMYKSIVLRLQAVRVEQDPARAKALGAEADRLSLRAQAMRPDATARPTTDPWREHLGPRSAPYYLEEEAAIRQLLRTFEGAYAAMSIEALQHVQVLSSLEIKALQARFANVLDYQTVLKLESIRFSSSRQATVKVRITETVTTKDRIERSVKIQIFFMEKRGDTWMIVKIEVQPL